MACTRIGASLVVHGPGEVTAQARVLASSIAADPEYAVVVVDHPGASAPSIADAVRTVLGEEARPLRLIPSAEAGGITLDTARKLADRIDRTVIYADGMVLTHGSGGCFLPPFEANGWVGCGPGGEPARLGRRYPAPEWEVPITVDPLRTGRSLLVEPLPAGVWLRSDGPQRWLDADRARLTRWLSVRPRELTAVLGGHGIPPVTLEDVVGWWALVPPETQARTRFLSFGDVSVPSDTTLGQALADALGEEIVLCGGLPVGPPETPEFFTLREDGSHSYRTFAEQITFSPRRNADKAAAPQIRRSRLPFPGLIELGSGVYWYEQDSVVEVVQAGLWLRTDREPARAAEVRLMSCDPGAFRVFFDPTLDGHDALAAKLLDRLDSSIRAGAKLFPVPSAPESRRAELPFAADLTTPLTPLPRLSRLLRNLAEETKPPEPAADVPYLPVELSADAVSPPDLPDAEPVPEMEPGTETESGPSVEVGRPTVQPSPRPEARAWPLPSEFVADPESVRAGREQAFDVLSEQMEKTWRRFAPNRTMSESGLTEAVAAGLYLAGDDPDLDEGLRGGAEGPHVDFGRCVAAGLQKLPVHRNVATTVVDPVPGSWELLHDGVVLTEWSFLNLLTAPDDEETGSTDLVVWSATGRLTASIEPKEGLSHRVVFLPGTAFKVLEVVEPEEKKRGRILMRELAESELGADGGKAGSQARDDLIRASLRRFASRSGGTRSRRAPGNRANRLGRIPGIVDPPDRKYEAQAQDLPLAQ
ncbi:hypothetical protein SD37_10085 [Amycolatopsis orientalis]|uniref:Uncharacterized protein n=1 Tax=Amycolatopsis orientalis TaxID=31958 RepID=A0A193CBK2_AMYOR|nr:hypothetical protein SD37_10085 [Amycolatopsis orientalis]